MMHDILKESDIYQMILQEGREEGLQATRQTLLRFVQARFPKLVRFATKQIAVVKDAQVLDDLIYKIGLSSLTEAQARQLFADLDKEEDEENE